MNDVEKARPRLDPGLKKLVQIGFVVADVERAVKTYWDRLGIGPWKIVTYDPSCVSDMRIRGRREDYAMRLAFAMVGDIEWELIQPLDDRSIYAEHLRRHGDSMHHLQFAVRDYAETKLFMKSNGYEDIQSGCIECASFPGVRYHYYDTQAALGFISEFSSPTADGFVYPSPDKVYPCPTG